MEVFTWIKYSLSICLLVSLSEIGLAQLAIAPQVNIALPIGSTLEYGVPQVGYGVEVSYQATSRWQVVAAYDRYQFGLRANRDKLNINGLLATLLNLPEVIQLDLRADLWSGGIRYYWPLTNMSPYLGIDGSTNRITAEGYGVRVSRRYWGVAPVIGIERSVAKQWSVQLETRVQTIFIRENIPFVEEFFSEYLVFVPLRAGVIFRPASATFFRQRK